MGKPATKATAKGKGKAVPPVPAVPKKREPREIMIDLVEGEFSFGNVNETLSKDDLANIVRLMATPEMASMKKWVVSSVRDLYRNAGPAGKDDAYIMCRVAKFLEDWWMAAESVMPEDAGIKGGDSFDQEGGDLASAVRPGGGAGADLPLAEQDAD